MTLVKGLRPVPLVGDGETSSVGISWSNSCLAGIWRPKSTAEAGYRARPEGLRKVIHGTLAMKTLRDLVSSALLQR